jgi:hypothetical protein
MTKRATPDALVFPCFLTPRPVTTTRTFRTALPASRTVTRTIVRRPTVIDRGRTVSV